LFKHAEHGEIAITTSDAIVAEVAYILTARSHYNAPRSVACAGIKRILELSACRLPSKATCIKALEVWALHPKLSFLDSLAAAYAELQRYELVTFDMALRALPSIAHYSFPAASSD
jgi:predicted nucleic acid-binding protein